jgi:hypothetical protein
MYYSYLAFPPNENTKLMCVSPPRQPFFFLFPEFEMNILLNRNTPFLFLIVISGADCYVDDF